MGSSIPGLSRFLDHQSGGMGHGAPSPMNTFDQMSGGGGAMDPMGSLRQHSDFATLFQRHPSSGPATMGWGGFAD